MNYYSLEIDEQVPSLNEMKKWHWSIWSAYMHRWSMFVLEQKTKKKYPRIKGYVTIEIIFVFDNKHKKDWDNYVAGTKGLMDGLKHHLIDDDNMDVIRDIHYKKTYGATAQTRVLIEEVV